MVVGACVASVVVLVVVAVLLFADSPPAFMDLDVYREGVQAWWHGRDMYGPLPPTLAGNRLPFIYPPFAAVILGPLALLPWTASAITMVVVSLASLGTVVHLSVRRVLPGVGTRGAVLATAVITPLALLTQPVHDTLWFGQVNLLLMALVALDCLVDRPKWPRGLLIGIAAAVKLTPAVFVLYLLLRKDFRAALTATVTGLVAVGIGFVASWSGSLRYWFGSSGGARSISGSTYYTNQTVDAFFARLGLGHRDQTLWWLTVVALVAVVAVVAIRRAHAIGDAPLAMAATGCLGLLASPTSWGHHWVYVVPGLIAMAGHAIRVRRVGWVVATLGTAVIFRLAPFLYLPGDHNRELHWNWLQQIPGNSYTITGIALLTALALTSRASRHGVVDRAQPYLHGRQVRPRVWS